MPRKINKSRRKRWKGVTSEEGSGARSPHGGSSVLETSDEMG